MVETGYKLASDPVAFRVLDLEFHQTLTRLAGTPFLERMAQSLYHLGPAAPGRTSTKDIVERRTDQET